MTIQEQIKKIEDCLATLEPSVLELIDDSHKHAGHAGARPGVVTHICVRIGCAKFKGLSRVSQHRLVLQALKPCTDDFLHAVQVAIIGCE